MATVAHRMRAIIGGRSSMTMTARKDRVSGESRETPVVVERGYGDLRHHHVDGFPRVIEGGRVQYDSACADEDSHREDPKEEPVQNHCHVFPVLFHLLKNPKQRYDLTQDAVVTGHTKEFEEIVLLCVQSII
ncbi:hypothetical protein AVEN_7833-1 [Araneus ventricosus]|uniref:Uncharacterized protein n=1 Tax=Araneus ventricosus TaxID=182803 RepID=A0A4Y2F2N4_ARAVE|nr:hypothetical protein AVEN_7833-1 [Araneus ventricosus]